MGLITPPCGVPLSRTMRLPSGICTGAFSHLSMYSSTHGHFVCLRTARISRFQLDTVEEGLDIKIQDPGVAPASLPCHADRIERRLAGSISIGVLVEHEVPRAAPESFDHHLGDSIGDRWNPQAAAFLQSLPSVCRPVAPAAESSCRTTFDSRACRGCSRDQPRSPRSIGHPRQPHLGWLSPFVGFPDVPLRNVERLCSIHEVPPVAG